MGALHYLTELAWLHEKEYFTSSAKPELSVIFLCAVVVSVNYIFYRLGFDINGIIPFFHYKYSIHFIFLAFVMAFSAVLLKNLKEK